MTVRALKREVFLTSRALEYFSEKELQLQTGHEPGRWPEVVLKELVDNALDACEGEGALPIVKIALGPRAIAVEDNGPGLLEVVLKSVVDFGVRASSKDHYVSPTRGAQGNALKTVLAIPFVMGEGAPGAVDVFSLGRRHQIRVAVDRIAQRPNVTLHSTVDDLVKTGTAVRVLWADSASLMAGELIDPFLQLIEGYALFNPHAAFQIITEGESMEFERSTESCAKWRADEPTSPHWYTADQLSALVAAYITAARAGQPARTVREFISEFRGLSATAKQKTIAGRLGLAGAHLHDLVKSGEVDKAVIADLLTEMRRESKAVKPESLGVIGEGHFRAWFGRHGAEPETFRYKRAAGIDDETGLPFVLEIAFAARRDDEGRSLVTGLNWSPTLVNPFRSFAGHYWGLESLLGELHAGPNDPVMLAIHLTCPRLNHTDRGKSSLEAVSPAIAEALNDLVRAVTKAWTKVRVRELRDAKRGARAREELFRACLPKEKSIKELAYEVMRVAYLLASGRVGLALARQVMYRARLLILARTSKQFDDQYFTQVLLPDYMAENPIETKDWDVVFDARGHLWEPHTGREVALGTLAVRVYLDDIRRGSADEGGPEEWLFPTVGPGHRFRNVLFVEKEGFMPLLLKAAIPSRFDLAVMSSKGLASTAARTLVEKLDGVRILTLHDFDVDGFGILGTLTRDTRRYTFSRQPDVVDLGLRLADVEAEGLESEPVRAKKNANPETLRVNGAGADEVEFLLNRKRRVELNAFTSDDLVDWLERKLTGHGVGKVVPDSETLEAAFRQAIHAHEFNALMEEVSEKARKVAEAADVPDGLKEAVERLLAEDPRLPWDQAVAETVRRLGSREKHEL